MADKILNKMASLLNPRAFTKYTKMGTADEEPVSETVRSSLEESIERLEEHKFTRWPNFTVEEGYEDEDDRDPTSLPGAASTAEIFFPPRSISKRSSNPFVRLKRMCTRFPIRDMSFMVGFSFTIGSAVFVANGFFLLLPLIDPTTNFGAGTPYLTPASSVLGTIIFLLGSYAAVLEALNMKRGVTVTEGQGVEMTRSVEITPIFNKEEEIIHHRHSTQSEQSSSSHVHSEKYTPDPAQLESESDTDTSSETHHASASPERPLALLGSSEFIYWPTVRQFNHTYRYDLYLVGAIIQSVGAVVFGVATATSIPGVIDFDNTTLVDFSNLLPASLGGLLFLTASILQMLSAQKKWWKIALGSLGWHIGTYIQSLSKIPFPIITETEHNLSNRSLECGR